MFLYELSCGSHDILDYVLTDSEGYYSFTDIFNGRYEFQAITGGSVSPLFKIVDISNANEEEVNFNSN